MIVRLGVSSSRRSSSTRCSSSKSVSVAAQAVMGLLAVAAAVVL